MAEHNHGCHKKDSFILLRSNPCISNLYILDRNSRLSYETIAVTYSDYILPILLFGNCPLTSKTGGCRNLLKSTPSRIPLIESNHKWTRVLFIISNSKLGIWICSQPRININPQSKWYDVLTLYQTIIFPAQSTKVHTLNIFYIYFLQVTLHSNQANK